MEQDNVLVVYFVKTVSSETKIIAKSYNYDLIEQKQIEVSSITLDKGEGTFFEGVYLGDSFTAIIYYFDKNSPKK